LNYRILIFCFYSLWTTALVAQNFTFFQPQEKRDSLLPIFKVGQSASYQVESQRELFEVEDKIASIKVKSALGMEVKSIDNERITLIFIIAKNQLLQRTFSGIFSFDDPNTQPVELTITVDKKTKFLSIDNYKSIAQMLLSELEQLRKTDSKYDSEKKYYNQIEKLKFDLQNGSDKLMRTTFVDLIYFFTAYHFPIAAEKKPKSFYRSDYEYFAPSRACVSEYKKFGSKDYFSVRYDKPNDTRPKSLSEIATKDFNFRYSVYFDENILPLSVGLFLMQQTDSQKIIETWTLLKQ
jgi:hypothetical protein